LQFKALSAPKLFVDARGGTGAPGFVGLDGGNGEDPGCTWGAAGHGFDGSNGSDGQPGAPGALVRLEVPREFPAELIKVNVAGGAGGPAGVGGKARAASPRAAWCTAPMAARTASPGRMVSLDRRVRRGVTVQRL
jgi:hypothetical protein